MTIRKSYTTDESENIKSVILDYQVYKKIAELLLDEGLLKAMKEVRPDEEIEYDHVRELIPPDKNLLTKTMMCCIVVYKRRFKNGKNSNDPCTADAGN